MSGPNEPARCRSFGSGDVTKGVQISIVNGNSDVIEDCLRCIRQVLYMSEDNEGTTNAAEVDMITEKRSANRKLDIALSSNIMRG